MGRQSFVFISLAAFLLLDPAYAVFPPKGFHGQPVGATFSQDPDSPADLFSESLPKPDDLFVMVEAMKKGGRVRVYIDKGKAIEWNDPHQVLWTFQNDFFSPVVEAQKNVLERQIATTYAGLKTSESVYLIFTDIESLGNSERLLGFEIQVRLPVSVDPKILPAGTHDFQGFFKLDGSRVFARSASCTDYIRTLI